ncbi:MAG: GNAT family N-acetyltransferase [Nocardioides sp.]
MDVSVCATDDDYEAWRSVRLAVVPGERCDTVAELRAQETPERLMLLARLDGVVVGSGLASRSDSSVGGFAAVRVLPEYRRCGVGSALLPVLADHVATLGLPKLRGMVEDAGSLAFAAHFGFDEVDRQVEQVRVIGDERPPPPLVEGVEVITLDQRPGLWAECYDTFGRQVLADFATYDPLDISAEQWNTSWAGDPMFLAVYDGEVIGCAGLHQDTDRPERAEHALTGVRQDWRGRGVAVHLKQLTLHWAAAHGLSEVYTWTQARNTPMLRLNEQLGYVTGKNSITVERSLPL